LVQGSIFTERVLEPQNIGEYQRQSSSYVHDPWGDYLKSQYVTPDSGAGFELRQYDTKRVHDNRKSFTLGTATVWEHSYPHTIWGDDYLIGMQIYELYWEQGNRYLELVASDHRELLECISILSSM